MKKITDEDLINSGFLKEESNDCEESFYYYTYDFADNRYNPYDSFCLISLDSIEAKKNNGFTVQIFESDKFLFEDIDDINKLIEILNKNIK